jgi:hypothetical protein
MFTQNTITDSNIKKMRSIVNCTKVKNWTFIQNFHTSEKRFTIYGQNILYRIDTCAFTLLIT